ncbi:MAG: bifunctional nuclease family protein [Bacteroidales bacterium]|nr:bifunctional nuclease family protein [Bacteroidales bacterium]
MNKLRLSIESLVYSQTQSGAYVLVMVEEGTNRKLPIVIGTAEAQAIAIALEDMNPPRPLTHDLFVNFAAAFNINILEVIITKLHEGIFYSELVCENFANKIVIDSRTSDAIALAVRFKCPIYAYQEVFDKAGVDPDTLQNSKFQEDIDSDYEPDTLELKHKTKEELKQMLNDAIKKEDYELASKIRDELKKK